jgi:small toxic polypeptide LdrA/B/C/D
MTYSVLNSIFLGLAVWIAVIAAVVAARRGSKVTSTVLKALGYTLAIMLVTTAIFDNVIIGVGLVAYDPSTLLGVFIGLAPEEDFDYAIAAVIILPALWTALGTTARARKVAQ